MLDVLIVEDDPTILETLSFLLRHEGWTVDAVSDGDQVMTLVRRKRPNVVLLDVMLPGMNGFDILKALRGDPDHGNTPVLILTARGQSLDRQLAQDLKADDFVTKPFSNDVLLEKVRQLLEKRVANTGRG